jgi:hypothetical protein
MDMKNQKGDHVAKQKTKINPRKQIQQDINEISRGLTYLFQESERVNKHLVGMETLIMSLAEFFKKRDEFEEFLETKIKKYEEKKEEKEEAKK